MSSWEAQEEARVRALVQATVALQDPAGAAGPGPRPAEAWRELLVFLCPHIESWARHSALLRRCRMANEDDARSVLVAVIERLAADDFANLRRFVARHPPIDLDVPGEEAQAICRLGKLGAAFEDDDLASEPTAVDTPFRAWLLTLVGFCERDHVRRRLGWSQGGPTRRDLHTDAVRQDDAAATLAMSSNPRLTDLVSIRQMLEEIDAELCSYPAPMGAAVRLWSEGSSPAEVARQLSLENPEVARRLVRAGQARLRARFRQRWSDTFACINLD
ncbi:hypothetical protein L6R53_27125 [Myxococcota bacterium]|nr:hypothetical protein [Myxococcota bacterium]